MNLRKSPLILRWISLLFILLAAVVLVFQLVQYSLQRSNYPLDMTIGEVPVGGLDPQNAAQRLLTAYSSPIELHYQGATIHLDPGLVSFEINVESMIAAADIERTNASFWTGFWSFIWNRPINTNSIPLVCNYSEEQLRTFLQYEISSRYDQPPTPSLPIPGTVDFAPGQAGQTLDIESAVAFIDTALKSPINRKCKFNFQTDRIW